MQRHCKPLHLSYLVQNMSAHGAGAPQLSVTFYKSFLLSVGCFSLTAIVPFVATKKRNITESFCLMSHHI